MKKEGKDLYFVALIPPKHVLGKYQLLKDHFTTEFGTKAAQKSPPHITIVPPFRMGPDELSVFKALLKNSARSLSPFDVEVNGYGRFESRVIFAHPFLSEELRDCRREVMGVAEQNFSQLLKIQSRPFHPHITLAFKDLRESDFDSAWESLKSRPLEDKFTVDKLSLLVFNDKWNIEEEFPFEG